jgi:alanine racemase
MSLNYTHRPTWAEINLDNLAYNFHSVKKFVGGNLKFMAVVKADGYGHNAVQCALRLEKEEIDWFGVALPEEGLELRNAGVKKPILCLGSFWFGQEEFLIENNLTPVIYQIEKAASLNEKAANIGVTVPIHVKIDTGMGRIGIRYDEIFEFAEKIKGFKNLDVQGLMTHFAAADDLSENNFTDLQISRFSQAVSIFENKGFRLIYRDLANSPGAIAHPESLGNMVRLGGVLYGLGGDILPKTIPLPNLKPVMSIYTRITHLKKVPKGETLGYSRTFLTERDSIIATIPIGYQDGLPRVLSNKGRVIINGKYAPIVGRISMDWTIIDVTNITNVKLEDEVVIVGEQNGLNISTEEVAKLSETISYEITCGINRRVVKKYVESK